MNVLIRRVPTMGITLQKLPTGANTGFVLSNVLGMQRLKPTTSCVLADSSSWLFEGHPPGGSDSPLQSALPCVRFARMNNSILLQAQTHTQASPAGTTRRRNRE